MNPAQGTPYGRGYTIDSDRLGSPNAYAMLDENAERGLFILDNGIEIAVPHGSAQRVDDAQSACSIQAIYMERGKHKVVVRAHQVNREIPQMDIKEFMKSFRGNLKVVPPLKEDLSILIAKEVAYLKGIR